MLEYYRGTEKIEMNISFLNRFSFLLNGHSIPVISHLLFLFKSFSELTIFISAHMVTDLPV